MMRTTSERRPTDRQGEPLPTDWSELFDLFGTTEVPDDFLDETDRARGKHDRDPSDDRRN